MPSMAWNSTAAPCAWTKRVNASPAPAVAADSAADARAAAVLADSAAAVPAEIAVAAAAQEATPEEDLRQELEDLKARYAQAVFEKDFAGQEALNLEKQVGDLKAMVEDFIEQGGYTGDAEAEALRAELEMVREQAGAELTALQTKLGDAEAAKAHLETDLQLVKVQLSVREAASEDDAAPAEKSSSLPAMLGGVAAGFLLAALVVGALFAVPAGRDLVRSWAGGEAAPAAVPAPTAAAPAVPAAQVPASTNTPN